MGGRGAVLTFPGGSRRFGDVFVPCVCCLPAWRADIAQTAGFVKLVPDPELLGTPWQFHSLFPTYIFPGFSSFYTFCETKPRLFFSSLFLKF